MRWILWATPFAQGWAVLVGGACWICFAEDMGLKENLFAWGLLASIPFIGTTFQMLGSYCVERANRRKLFFFIGFMSSKCSWAVMALLPILLGVSPAAAIACVLVLFMFNHSANAFAMPSWMSWMSDVIPARARGRFFGLRAQIGPFIVVPFALIAGWLLDGAARGQLAYPSPSGMFDWSLRSVPFHVTTLQLSSIFFVIAAVLGAIDILMFAPIPDRPRARPAGQAGLRAMLSQPLANPEFRRFITFYGAFYLSVPGIGYYVWLYVKNPEGVGVGPFWAQVIFFGGGQLGLVLCSGIWGRLIDRFGRKAIWTVGCIVPIFLPVMYGALHPAYAWLGFFVALIDVLGWQGVELANFNGMLHFSGSQKGSAGYQAIYALVLAVAGMISGLLFGMIAQAVGGRSAVVGGFTFNYFHAVFLVATLMRLTVYLTLLPRVTNDGRQSVREAVATIVSAAGARARAPFVAVWRTFVPRQ